LEDFRSILVCAGLVIAGMLWNLPAISAPAQSSVPSGFRVVQDFRDTWRFYSKSDAALLPYIPENEVKTHAVYFQANPSRYPGEQLIIAVQAGSSLWIDDQVIGLYAQKDTLYLPMDSLSDRYGGTTLNFAVYNPDRTISGLLTIAGEKSDTAGNRYDLYPMLPRKHAAGRDVFVLLGMLIIVFFTVLFNVYPKNGRLLFNLSYALTGSSSLEETFNPRTISKAQFLFMLGMGSIASFLLLVFHRQVGIAQLSDWLEATPLPLAWLSMSLLFFVLINLKYLLIVLMSRLFSIEEKVYNYFFDIFILSMVFYSALFVVVVAAGLTIPHKMTPLLNALVYAVTVYYLLRVALLFIKIRSRAAVKNLHLFSYLCTTELLPVVVGIKYFFG
jgi:hypothetical protein